MVEQRRQIGIRQLVVNDEASVYRNVASHPSRNDRIRVTSDPR